MHYEGYIHTAKDAKALLRAFRDGRTWIQKRRSKRGVATLVHKQYGNESRVRLQRLAPGLLQVEIEDAYAGRVVGAFMGHLDRHGAGVVERVDMECRATAKAQRRSRR